MIGKFQRTVPVPRYLVAEEIEPSPAVRIIDAVALRAEGHVLTAIPIPPAPVPVARQVAKLLPPPITEIR